MKQIKDIVEKFYSSEFDESDSYNLCTLFQDDEFLFKKIFLSGFPADLSIDKIKLVFRNLKKLKDEDAKFIVKSVYYNNLFKRLHVIDGWFDDIFQLIIQNKDFEKSFYYYLGNVNPDKITYICKELSKKKDIDFIDQFFLAFQHNSYYQQNENSDRIIKSNNLDRALFMLPTEQISQIHKLSLNERESFSMHRIDNYLFNCPDSENENIKKLQKNYINNMFLQEMDENSFLYKMLDKSKNSSFFQEMQCTYIFDYIIKYKKQPTLNQIFELCNFHKDCFYICSHLINVIPKKEIFKSLLEIDNQQMISAFLEKYSSLDEVKSLLIYL